MVVAVESVRAVGRRGDGVAPAYEAYIGECQAEGEIAAEPVCGAKVECHSISGGSGEIIEIDSVDQRGSIVAHLRFPARILYTEICHTFRAGSPLVVAEVGFGVAKVYVGTAYSDEQLNRSTHGETLHKLIEAVGVLEREFGICVGSGVDIADIVHPVGNAFLHEREQIAWHTRLHICHCVEAHVVVAT